MKNQAGNRLLFRVRSLLDSLRNLLPRNQVRIQLHPQLSQLLPRPDLCNPPQSLRQVGRRGSLLHVRHVNQVPNRLCQLLNPVKFLVHNRLGGQLSLHRDSLRLNRPSDQALNHRESRARNLVRLHLPSQVDSHHRYRALSHRSSQHHDQAPNRHLSLQRYHRYNHHHSRQVSLHYNRLFVHRRNLLRYHQYNPPNNLRRDHRVNPALDQAGSLVVNLHYNQPFNHHKSLVLRRRNLQQALVHSRRINLLVSPVGNQAQTLLISPVSNHLHYLQFSHLLYPPCNRVGNQLLNQLFNHQVILPWLQVDSRQLSLQCSPADSQVVDQQCSRVCNLQAGHQVHRLVSL